MIKLSELTKNKKYENLISNIYFKIFEHYKNPKSGQKDGLIPTYYNNRDNIFTNSHYTLGGKNKNKKLIKKNKIKIFLAWGDSFYEVLKN
jgi:hypothetical protein